VNKDDQTKYVPVELAPVRNAITPYSVNFDLSNLLGNILPQLQTPQVPNVDLNNPVQQEKISNNPVRPQQNPATFQNPGSNALNPLLTVDLCYYLGDDVLDSHVKFFDWFDGSVEAYKTYVNLLTLQAKKLMNRVDKAGQVYNNDFQLTWRGPWQRSDHASRYPDRAREDTKAAAKQGCDVVIFLVFNNYTGVGATEGHDIAGYAEGAACEASVGSGFAAVIDQGFYQDTWVGPQVLAHHLFLLLTSDLFVANNQIPNQKLESRNCPSPDSILYDNISTGQQYRDKCLNSKLERSSIPRRSCLQT
jgi:hypothetical protein